MLGIKWECAAGHQKRMKTWSVAQGNLKVDSLVRWPNNFLNVLELISP